MFSTKTPYSPESRSKIVEILNQRVANLLVLYSQAKNAHWNCKGVLFYELHLLFDRVAGELLAPIDTLAERLASMGGVVNGTVHQAALNSTLPVQPPIVSGVTYVFDLIDKIAQEYAEVIASTEVLLELKDNSTANMLSSIEETLGTHLYLLESTIQIISKKASD